MKNQIRKTIREEIQKLFELESFQTDAAEQLAMNISLHKLPRKGMDDSINYFNQVQLQKEKEKSQEEKEKEVEDGFGLPSSSPNAPVLTNVYGESYGMYGSTHAAQQNLDWERPLEPKKGFFSQEVQDEFDLHNNNIERELKTLPPGNSREGGVKNNKSKNY